MNELESLIEQAETAAKKNEVNPQAAALQIAEVRKNMQDPAQLEQMISAQQEKLLAEILPQLMPSGNDPMSDPLVQIRMRELDLKKQDLDRKVKEDQDDMTIERAKMQQKAVTDAARIESQEEIAENRNEVNLERIDVQRQAKRRG